MKVFAEFFHHSTGYVEGSIPPRFDGPKKLIAACGSDSVAILDGRHGTARLMAEAQRIARQRSYPAFRIMRGARFSAGQPTTNIIHA